MSVQLSPAQSSSGQLRPVQGGPQFSSVQLSAAGPQLSHQLVARLTRPITTALQAVCTYLLLCWFIRIYVISPG